MPPSWWASVEAVSQQHSTGCSNDWWKDAQKEVMSSTKTKFKTQIVLK